MCHIEEVDTHVNTLVLQEVDCDATTRWGRINLQATTPNPTNPSILHMSIAASTSQRHTSCYDVLSQLGKTLGQISII